MSAPNNVPKSYLDVIFEGRNKQYGGYELRSCYPQRIAKATVGILAAALLVSVVMILSGFRSHPEKPDARKISIDLSDLHQILPPTPPIPPTPPTPPKHLAATPHSTQFQIVKDPDANTPPVTDVRNLSQPSGNAKTGADSEGTADGDAGGKPATEPAVPVYPQPSPTYTIAEIAPEPGYDLQAYFLANLHYPEQAKDVNIQGRVVVRFVVNENGDITDLQLVHGIGSGCDEEAMRVIGAMPPWKPGKQKGIPVKVYFTQAVTFKLE